GKTGLRARRPLDRDLARRAFLLEAVSPEGLGNSRLDFPCRRDVPITADDVAGLAPGQSASVERARQPRSELQRRAEIGNRLVPSLHLQIGEAARIEGTRGARLQSDSLVAVDQRRVQFAEHRAAPAASIPRAQPGRLEPNGFAVIANGLRVVALV